MDAEHVCTGPPLRLAACDFADMPVQLAVESAYSPVDWTPPRFKRVHAVGEAGTTALLAPFLRPVGPNVLA